jgi:hypothetical protein
MIDLGRRRSNNALGLQDTPGRISRRHWHNGPDKQTGPNQRNRRLHQPQGYGFYGRRNLTGCPQLSILWLRRCFERNVAPTAGYRIVLPFR